MPRFKVPLPPGERIVILTSAIVGAVILGYIGTQLEAWADQANLAIADLLARSQSLRLSLVGVVVVYLLGLWLAWSYANARRRTTLEISEDELVYDQHGLLARHTKRVPLERIDKLSIRKVTRGASQKVRLRVHAGSDEVDLFLEAADPGDGYLLPKPFNSDKWREHPLVVALESRTELTAECS